LPALPDAGASLPAPPPAAPNAPAALATGSLPAASPSPPAPPATAAPAVVQPGAAVVIRSVVNAGRAERVVIANEGAASQGLTGWRLRSANGGQVYAFPDGITLLPGTTIAVHSGAGDPAALHRPPTDLFATRSNIWRNQGDVAQLVAPDGRVVAEYRYGQPE
jgi:hypothetical protein